jgi:La-related protein 7
MSPAAATSAKTGLDLVVPANFGAISYALVEYETRDEASRAVATLNDDEDWRRGLRVRLLVKHLKKKKKATREEACEDDAPAREGGEDDGEASRSGAAEGGDGEGPGGDDAPAAEEAAGASGKKKKKKFGRQKRDYSQWASAAAFKENKQTFLTEGEDGGVGTAGDAAADGAAPGAESVAPLVSSAPPRAPTMPDGTRGFAFGAATGKPRRAFPPGVPTEPKKTEAAEAERLAPETAEETRSSE